MPRTIWKGSISFGLLNVPVALYSGEQRNDLQFHLLDSRDNSRVRYQRVNEETGQEVPWDEIVKAYEYDGGQYVLLDDEDFKKVKPEASQTVELQGFVDKDAIDYVYFDKPYYLAPINKGEKGYVLLRETLRKTGKVGIAKVVIRTRQYLAVLLPEGDALVLDLIRFKQELRDPEDLNLPGANPQKYKISNQELDMAAKLVESMSTEWDPEQYHDDYREAVLEFIEEKAKKGAVERPEAAEEEVPSGDVIDLMGLLKKSVEQKSGRKEEAKKEGRKSKKKA